MPVAQPPYALTPASFRFAALASLAGRAPLGGRREIALAVYLAARLAQDALPAHEVPQQARAERAGSAKQWLSTLSLPATVRPAIAGLIDASSRDAGAVSAGVRGALSVAGEALDRNARGELLQLASALEACGSRKPL